MLKKVNKIIERLFYKNRTHYKNIPYVNILNIYQNNLILNTKRKKFSSHLDEMMIVCLCVLSWMSFSRCFCCDSNTTATTSRGLRPPRRRAGPNEFLFCQTMLRQSVGVSETLGYLWEFSLLTSLSSLSVTVFLLPPPKDEKGQKAADRRPLRF